jgi:hypothetical protein
MKTTNKILLGLLVLILLVITVFMVVIRVQLKAAVFVEPSGQIITNRVVVPPFNEIEASGNLKMFVRQGDRYEVLVRADDNLMEYILAEVDGETLNVSFRGWSGKNATIEIEVDLRDLKSLKAMAGANIRSEGTIQGDVFRHIVNSGAQSLLYIDFNFLELELSSGGNASLNGRIREMNAKNDAGGILEASGLEAEKVKLSTSAGSVSNLFVTEELEVKASTGSTVNFTGNPLVKEISSSTGASVNPR